MGGPESGNRIRFDAKKTTESQHRIDLRWLRKNGNLQPGTLGSLSWTSRGKRTGSINYLMDKDCMAISFRYREYGSEWQEITQVLFFDYAPCNYAGQRTGFLCPKCGKRAVILYGAGRLFFCRHCHGLTYASQ